jgi:hypothetical protein
LDSYYYILRWIKLIGGSFSLKKIYFFKNLNGEHPLWKTQKSLEKPGNQGFPGKFSSIDFRRKKTDGTIRRCSSRAFQ